MIKENTKVLKGYYGTFRFKKPHHEVVETRTDQYGGVVWWNEEACHISMEWTWVF